jgi:UDP-N-acetylmuramoyl-tripeptide--D-alanyl-D-alanine ligase
MKTSIVNRMLLSYLRFFARLRLALIHPRIIGVTGSVGKSSFVYLLDKVASSVYNVKTTFHGNSETGLPLEILGLRHKLTDYGLLSWLKIAALAPFYSLINRGEFNLLIAEMGVDSPHEPKNMGYLLKIIRPDVGVILNVSGVHTEQFSTLLPEREKSDTDKLISLIAREKGRLISDMPEDKTAVVNKDIPQLAELLSEVKAKTVTFGECAGADFRMTGYAADISRGTVFEYIIWNKKYSLKIPGYILFKEYGLTILAVIAAAGVLHIPPERAITLIRDKILLPPGRFSVLAGKKNTTIIDSSYNSSPAALESQLNFLGSVRGRRIALLGDMRELGPAAPDAHRRAASGISGNTDSVILIGPLMKDYALPELIKLKYPVNNITVFANSAGVGEYMLKHLIKGGETILIKGSQNTIFTETVVEDLLENPDDKKLLCRQEPYWQKYRQNFFAANPNRQYYP